MKFKIFIVFLTISAFLVVNNTVLSIQKFQNLIKANNHKKEKINIIGESYTNNEDLALMKHAVATSKAKVNISVDDELNGFTKPQTVKELSEEVPMAPKGPLESIEEIPTPHDYYNGDLKLNVVKVKCQIYTAESDCIHSSNCGWCGSSNSCVLGNNFGPLQPCVKSSFIYGRSYPNYHPTIRTINENVGGVSSTIVSGNGYK